MKKANEVLQSAKKEGAAFEDVLKGGISKKDLSKLKDGIKQDIQKNVDFANDRAHQAMAQVLGAPDYSYIDENYEPTTEDFEERNDAMNQNARVK